MEQTKVRPEPAEAAWDAKADAEHYSCIRCGNQPKFEDREMYFETNLCGECLKKSDNDG